MTRSDVRWLQRFQNFQKALTQLLQAVELSHERALSALEQQGLIQAFEYTHELAWNTLKDFLEARGTTGLYGSRDATRAAFELGLIEPGDVWMQMIQSRNATTHTYNEHAVEEIVTVIKGTYAAAFTQLNTRLEELKVQEFTA